jgi:hypothetical protein
MAVQTVDDGDDNDDDDDDRDKIFWSPTSGRSHSHRRR